MIDAPRPGRTGRSIGAVATWNRGPELGPKWYALAVMAIALPCAWAGGKLREAQLRVGTTAARA